MLAIMLLHRIISSTLCTKSAFHMVNFKQIFMEVLQRFEKFYPVDILLLVLKQFMNLNMQCFIFEIVTNVNEQCVL